VIHSVGTRDMREMGGLGKKMPVTRAVFVIGALALAGLPILNGFWSKELVLEAGLSGGPTWMFALMVLGAGLTAFYTYRMVYMVFYGEPRSALHGHDAGLAMKIALIPLALGTLTTWLLAGRLGLLLENVPSFEGVIEAQGIKVIAEEIFTAPATYIALAVIVLGLIAWWQRERLTGIAKLFKGFNWAAANSFGFEAVNRAIVKGTQSSAEAMRATQTGLLNWNVFAIMIGLVIVLAILALGA